MSLFKHMKHEYQPRNVNLLHKAEIATAGFNQKIAVGMTKLFSSMGMFWAILLGMSAWMVLNTGFIHVDPPPWQFLLTYGSLVQLPLMIVIMVGQALLGRHQELQSQEQYDFTVKSYHDIEQIMAHLDAQDEQILEILQKLAAKP